MSYIDEKFTSSEFDLEALNEKEEGLIFPSALEDASPTAWTQRLRESYLLQKFIGYPAPGSLKIKSTSWLDGVRGVAAFEVYLFHSMGCWASTVLAWHANAEQNNLFQLPLIRTFVSSGGAAVCLFFAISGYVLTYKSLSWMRERSPQKVYPAVASSMFRRGIRLYLPPIFLTFCEMLATRVGFTPALNFTFVAEATLYAQFVDWLQATNLLVNPAHNFYRAIRGFVTHPKYEAVVWTIPLEFYGSFVCYFLLLVLSKIHSNNLRMTIVALFATFSMALGCWNIFCFATGMLIADINLGQAATQTLSSPSQAPKHTKLWTAIFALCFYVAGFPTLLADAKFNPMPGFEFLLNLTPFTLTMEDHARFLWSLSGVGLLLSISQLPKLKSIFESDFCQYLGRVSFSLYLAHESCLVVFGLRLQTLLFVVTGISRDQGGLSYWFLCVVWYGLITLPIFAVAEVVTRFVDAPSVRFARWLEGRCISIFRS